MASRVGFPFSKRLTVAPSLGKTDRPGVVCKDLASYQLDAIVLQLCYGVQHEKFLEVTEAWCLHFRLAFGCDGSRIRPPMDDHQHRDGVGSCDTRGNDNGKHTRADDGGPKSHDHLE